MTNVNEKGEIRNKMVFVNGGRTIFSISVNFMSDTDIIVYFIKKILKYN